MCDCECVSWLSHRIQTPAAFSRSKQRISINYYPLLHIGRTQRRTNERTNKYNNPHRNSLILIDWNTSYEKNKEKVKKMTDIPTFNTKDDNKWCYYKLCVGSISEMFAHRCWCEWTPHPRLTVPPTCPHTTGRMQRKVAINNPVGGKTRKVHSIF